jgi:hypothetical protein
VRVLLRVAPRVPDLFNCGVDGELSDKPSPRGYPARERPVGVYVDGTCRVNVTVARIEERKKATGVVAVPVRDDNAVDILGANLESLNIPEERARIGAGVKENLVCIASGYLRLLERNTLTL